MEDPVDAFEDGWQRGEGPSIDDFLPSDPAARFLLLGRLIHIDLEYRLRRRETIRVEAYLARYPELAAEGAVLLDLLAWEYHLRQSREPGLSMTEYVQRFPQL